MNIRTLRKLILVLISATFLGSCTLFDDLTYSVDPNPLEMHGDSVAVSITATIPPKKINKSAIANITPVLKYNGQEKVLKMVTVQGEKAAGNGTIINSKTGGKFTYSDVFAYSPDMMVSELIVKAKVGKGTPTKDYESEKIADGIITTPNLVLSDDKPIMAKDKFQRITSHSEKAVVNYLVNSSIVRPTEMKDADIKALIEFFEMVSENESYQIKSITSDAYASPEGEISRNENLADERAASASKAVAGLLKKAKISTQDGLFKNKGMGEDWDGFKTAMQGSDIEDRNLIIRILETYNDKNEREKEIKNLSATYLEIKEKILPALRRSQMSVNYDIVGYSDEELKNLSKSNPAILNVEELLYSATLFEDLNEKANIYGTAAKQFAGDYRGSNNLGYVYMMQNKMSDAETQFAKASGIQSNPITENNTAIFKRRKGNRSAAYKSLKDATSAGSEVSYNMGIIDIQNGNYTEAVRHMGDTKSFNAALARLLNGDANGAGSILDASPEKDSAEADYLRAIIAARTDNPSGISSKIQSAISKNSALKERAMKDAEFLKYKDSLGF